MCGIGGIVRFDGQPVDAERLKRSCAVIRHRGPDHTGTWFDASRSVGLGAVRLAVIDPSPACHQPFHYADGRYIILFNGAAYNYREVRRELIAAGDTFRTDGDTEVVAAACARWGVEALTRFNGMWASAFYDNEKREGFVVRDRFGIKPLFYTARAGAMTFCSEMGGLMALGESGDEIDQRAVAHLVQYVYIAPPHTILKQAHRLPPGHYLPFSAKGVGQPTRYYQLHPNVTEKNGEGHGDYAEIRTHLRKLINDAVVRRRVADVPLGAFLSGGIDSSIVVKHLAEASGRPVKTFSIGFEGHGSYDETKYARLVAKTYGTDHHEIRLTQDDVLETIPRVLDHLGEPQADSSIVPTSLVSQFARQELTVSLSGDGGDELFGGYRKYAAPFAIDIFKKLPGSLQRALARGGGGPVGAAMSRVLGKRARHLQKVFSLDEPDPAAYHVLVSRILSPESEDLLREPGLSRRMDAETLETLRAVSNGASPSSQRGEGELDALNQILAFDFLVALPSDMLQKVDTASMMHSLEVRVPMLDVNVVEYAMSLPSKYKVRRGLCKRIIVDTYRGHLPDEILDRPKMGFEVPFSELVRGPLREMFLDTVTRDAIDSFGILSYSAVERMYREHCAQSHNHANVMFALLSLCWWKKKWRVGKPKA